MVPLSALEDRLNADVEQGLRRRVESDYPLPPLETFLSALVGALDPSDPSTISALAAATSEKAARTHRDIAALGYALRLGMGYESAHAPLREGLEWLFKRPAYVGGVLAPFVDDAESLLGLAAGAATLGGDPLAGLRSWLSGFQEESIVALRSDPFRSEIYGAARALAGVAGVGSAGPSAVARVALAASGLAPGGQGDDWETEALSALEDLRKANAQDLSGLESIMGLGAIRRILRERPTIQLRGASPEQIASLLRRVPAALRRWTWETSPRTGARGAAARKWHIDNEYHVQSLLYFLLSPIFPDLLDEEYVSSVGQKHPRLDLYVPSLRLIIEVKFMRKSMTPQDLIGQIAEDASLYRADRPDHEILAFVWDDSGRSAEHDLMQNGLKRLPGVSEAVIVSRPSNFS